MDESVAGMAPGGRGASGPANDGAAGASATEGAALSDPLNVATPARRRLSTKSPGPYHTASPTIRSADGAHGSTARRWITQAVPPRVLYPLVPQVQFNAAQRQYQTQDLLRS